MSFPFDGERCIDDFVMLTILCGNDFIPNLPSLDIGEGAMDQMLRLYRCVLAFTLHCSACVPLVLSSASLPQMPLVSSLRVPLESLPECSSCTVH
jgi:hypothetical protein